LKLALAIPAVSAQAQIPVLDCAVLNPRTGQITAFFGYKSNTNAPTAIPFGASNFVDRGTVTGTIPVTFPRPSEQVLFSVTFFSGQTVAWHLNGQAATASAQSVASPACQSAVGTTLPNYAARRCWDRRADNTCDIANDRDGDGYCTLLDCAGTPGSTGNQGLAGASGAKGLPGTPGTAPQFQTITSSPTAAIATASCGASQFLVTGGGSCTVPNLPGMGRVAASAASSDGNGWSVSCSAGQATAVAVCAQKP
jgi:hypothetical protein